MTTYFVSTTGADSNTGLSAAQAWRTPAKAIVTNAPAAGSIIKIAPGTYQLTPSIKGMAPATNGAASGGVDPDAYDVATWITVQRDDAYAPAAGAVIIEGSGCGSCITFYGSRYWLLSNLTFSNITGNAASIATTGIEIFDAFALPTGQNNGAHHIHIVSCSFQNINRNVAFGPTSYGAPIVGGSYANTPVAPFPVGCHQVKVATCAFYDSQLSNDDTSHSHVNFAGNMFDALVSACQFFCTRIPASYAIPAPISQGGVGYKDCQGGIEFGGNQLPICDPPGPYKIVVTNNRFDYETTNLAGGVYTSACQQTLIAGNYFRNCTYPIGLQAEMGARGASAQKMDRVWCRENIINGGERTVYAMSMGAYTQPADIYQNVKRTTFSNNTVDMASALIGGFGAMSLVRNSTPGAIYGVTGVENDCRIINNICTTAGENIYIQPPTLSANLLDYNLYASDSAAPYFWLTAFTSAFPYNVSQEAHSQQVARSLALFQPGYTGSDAYHLIQNSVAESTGSDPTPAWYVAGVFGYFEPLVYVDFYGEPRTAPWDLGAAIYRDTEDLLPAASGIGAVRLGSATGPVIVALANDPTAGGMAGPAGSFGMQLDGSLWHKFATGYTAWRKLVDTFGLAAALDAMPHFATGLEIGGAGSAQLLPLTTDPRFNAGIVAPRGSLGVLSNGTRRQLLKYGTGNTQWVALDDMGSGLWPAILDTRSAVDVTATLAACVTGMTAAPDRLVQFDEASGAAIELIVGQDLTSTGGNATRVLTSLKNGRLDSAAHQVDGSASYWQAASTSAWKTPGTTAFAYIMLVKATAASGSYILSEYKQSGQAKGFHLGMDAAGQLIFGINGTSGVSALASQGSNHLNAWHLVIVGRSVTSGTIHVCSDLGDGTNPSGLMGDISNTDATFLIGADLFGSRSSGMTGDVTCLARFTNANAEAVITNRVALCASLAGGTITGAVILPSTVQQQGVSSPSAITGTQNNYAPFNLTMASIIRQDLTAAATLTGLTGGVEGRLMTIFNVSTVQARTLTIAHDSASSTAANRFYLPNGLDWIIPIHGCATFMYDSVSLRWRMTNVATNNFPSGTLASPGVVVGSDTDHGIFWDGASPKLVSDGAFAMSWGGASSGGAGSTGFNSTMLTGAIYSTGTLILSADSTPTAITGALNNYALPAGSTCIRQDCSAASSLTGLGAGGDGQIITIHNIATNVAFTLTLNHENASSTAGNRFILPLNTNAVINAGGSVTLRYDATSARWRVIGASS